MSKYKIHIDNNPPSKARIDAYKDFDSLHKQYQLQSRYEFWRNLYRNPRYFAVLVALISVSVLVYQSSLKTPSSEAAFILPPIPPKDIPLLEEGLNPEQPRSFTYENGTQIHVPVQAFVDENNEEVSGKVELRYREFRDAADIFIAGIPMDYDSAGKSYTLESAGMLEILAYSEGKPVYLKEGKTLEVEYFSPYKGADYNVYHLDTLARNWNFEGEDLLRESQQESEVPDKPELEYILDREADTFLTRNVRIPNQKPGRVFQIALSNAEDYALLSGKENLIWEYIQLPAFSDPWQEGLLPGEAAIAHVKPYRAAGVFLLELKGGGEFVARPLLNARNFESAHAAYEEKLAAYKKALAEYNAQKELAKKKLAERETALKAYEEELAEWEAKNRKSDSLATRGVYRRFIIKKLGINQLGRKLDYPMMQIKVDLNFQEDTAFGEQLAEDNRRISLIHPGINTVFSCQHIEAEKGKYMLRFDPTSQNLLCVSDQEENLYLLDFRQIPSDLRMKFQERESSFSDHASLKKHLQNWLEKIEPTSL
ncbi:MAG: hypothetical protein R8P61_29835 [Bacteroidia bacterium]|nr:hypothetical protein [Bacteroidia bacterium]